MRSQFTFFSAVVFGAVIGVSVYWYIDTTRSKRQAELTGASHKLIAFTSYRPSSDRVATPESGFSLRSARDVFKANIRTAQRAGTGNITETLEQSIARAIAEIERQGVEQLLNAFDPTLVPKLTRSSRLYGPAIPDGITAPYRTLIEPSLNMALPTSWSKQKISLSVIFRTTKPTPDSNHTRGNGILLNPTTILTAKHVAQDVEANSGDIEILLVGDSVTEIYIPLVFERVQYLRPTSDPDLALVIVKKSDATAKRTFLGIATRDPEKRRPVYSVGCSEFEELPKLNTAIVTTKTIKRGIDDKGVFSLTTFGTTLRSFPSISGSPVFDSVTGEVLGVVVAGQKAYAGSGEQLIKVEAPESRWEKVRVWTWVAPTSSFHSEIRQQLATQ